MRSSILAYCLGLFTTACFAQNPDWGLHWTWRNPLPQGDTLNGVAFGNGSYVAVSLTGAILTSTNRTDWMKQHSVTCSLESVAFIQGKFFAVGGGSDSVIATSTNGRDWKEKWFPTSGRPFRAVAYGNGRFVAAGGGYIFPTMAVSTNGEDWSMLTLTNRGAPHTIVFGKGRFVAMGEEGFTMTSTSGTNWQRFETGVSNEIFRVVSFVEGRFVATTTWGGIHASIDGTNWFYQASLPPSQILPAHGQFFATWGNRVLVSSDLQSWTTNVLALPTYAPLMALAADSQGVVAVGWNGAIAASSNGIDWQLVTSRKLDSVGRMIYANGQYVAMQGNDSVLTSSNGRSWLLHTNIALSGGLLDRAFANGLFVGVGYGTNSMWYQSAYIASSADGVTWNQVLSTNGMPLRALAHGGGRWVAVGGYGAPVVATSLDGIQWTYSRLMNWDSPPSHGFPFSDDGVFYDVAFGGGLFVATGTKEFESRTYGLLARSTNGTNWDGDWHWSMQPMGRIAYGNGRFVAVDRLGYVLLTTNGNQWTRFYPTGLDVVSDLIFSRGVFVAVGPPENQGHVPFVATSVNGSNWTYYPLPTRIAPGGITEGRNTYFVTGRNGMILESSPFWQPRLSYQRASADMLTLIAESEPGFLHTIEASTNLQDWQPIHSFMSAGQSSSITVNMSNAPATLYRVRVPD